MTKLKPLDNEFRYKRIIGTGGLGTGMFFRLQGNHTLGRNESRPGERMPYKDYCKQHIILHYIAVLLSGENFEVYPIGKVGDDEQGKQIFKEMAESGMKMCGVKTEPGASTLFSVCFIYPDSTGGNITTSLSASSMVAPSDITEFMALLDRGGISIANNEASPCNTGIPTKDIPTIILAAPEVPVETRVQLLKEGRKRGCFNAASVLTGEVEEFYQAGGFELIDLLSVNIDEAASIANLGERNLSGTIAASGVQYSESSFSENPSVNSVSENSLTDNSSNLIAQASYEVLSAVNPDIMLIVTDGPGGSYCFNKGIIEHVPPLKTEAAATGGAGDALLSGTLTGLCCGLSFMKGRSDSVFSETAVKSAVELGTILASLSVTTYDSIHQTVTPDLLKEYALSKGVVFSSEFRKIFGF